MANPVPPYFVEFSADSASSARIDQSQAAPGGAVDRAGHTTIQSRGSLTWKTETGPPRSDGLVPFSFRSMKVLFRLSDYVVQITSSYRPGSCTYNATMRHEVNEHIVNPTRLLFGFRDQVVQALNKLPLPIATAPRWVRADQAAAVEAEYVKQVGGVVKDFRNKILNAMREASLASDAPKHYGLVYRQCPLEEWN